MLIVKPILITKEPVTSAQTASYSAVAIALLSGEILLYWRLDWIGADHNSYIPEP
jgi:hypothetical protein